MPSSLTRPRLLSIVAITAALLCAFLLTRHVVRPTYTDAYYHYNAAVRLATGQGFTDTVIWTYTGQPVPDTIPATVVPSHLYWMPLSSLLAGGSMALFNAPGDYAVAQLPFLLVYVLTLLTGYTLGWRIGGTQRHALIALALTTFSGYFARFMGEMDTFAPYAAFGSLALLMLGQALHARDPRAWLAAGVLAGLGHLTRADGLLLLLVGWAALLLLRGWTLRQRLTALLLFTVPYLLVMLPWFARMIAVTGSPLPVGGLQAIWFTQYNDLFRFPPAASAADFFANGIGPGIELLLQTRWLALVANLQTLLFVEGYVVLMPLMFIGGITAARRGHGALLLPFTLFAIGIHLAMTLVFPFPGARGGLFHGAAALIPWWAALAVVGLDTVIDWLAARRKRWQPRTAKRVFSLAMVGLAVALTLTTLRATSRSTATPTIFTWLQTHLPAEARVLINDPAQLAYYTGLGGAVLPQSAPDVLPEIAARYGITHLVLEDVRVIDGRTVSRAIPGPLQTLLEMDPLPPYLEAIPAADLPGVRVYVLVDPDPAGGNTP